LLPTSADACVLDRRRWRRKSKRRGADDAGTVNPAAAQRESKLSTKYYLSLDRVL